MPKAREVRIPVVIEKRGRWYVGYVPSIPGINVQERTLKATRESLASAIEELREIDPKALALALDVEKVSRKKCSSVSREAARPHRAA